MTRLKLTVNEQKTHVGLIGPVTDRHIGARA